MNFKNGLNTLLGDSLSLSHSLSITRRVPKYRERYVVCGVWCKCCHDRDGKLKVGIGPRNIRKICFFPK